MKNIIASLSSLLALVCLGSSASADAFADTAFNVLDYGADPAPGTNDNSAIQAAFADALNANGVLLFPVGSWDLTAPLVITKRVEIRGVGASSILKYTGTGAALQGAFTHANVGEHTLIRDLYIRGTDGEGQSAIAMGTNGVPPQLVTIRNLITEQFANGYGIFLQTPIDARVEQNRIGAARVGIALRTPCTTTVSQNFLSYWANYGIYLYSVSGDGLASRNNNITQNVIHGNGVIAQDVLQSRAAIKVARVGSTTVQNNYVEAILTPAGGGGMLGHGVWVEGDALTQSNRVIDNYFGPNTSGDAIRLGPGGPVSHTTISGNAVGNYAIRDDGLYTIYNFQYVTNISQAVGGSTTRRGWIGLTNSVVQLHP